ncbi:MAG: hypothetical protein U0822_25680 [Anaerolineae bacterium]
MMFSLRPISRWLPLVGAAALALTPLGGLGSAAASAGAITEFPLSGANLAPTSITAGPDGNLWFTENGSIGRMTTSGTVTQFPHAAGTSMTPGPDGALWFTETGRGMIGRVTTSGAFAEFNLPGNPPPGATYSQTLIDHPEAITVGPDGALWFTVQSFSKTCSCTVGGKIGRITTGGAITEFTLPSGNTRSTRPRAMGITTGPDGALWFTDTNLATIGRMTTSGALTQFNVPQGRPQGITAGPDGNLWFTANSGQNALLGRLTPGGAFTEFTVASSVDGVSVGMAIAAGPDNNLWIADYDTLTATGSILRVTTGGAVTTFPLAQYDEIDGITRGPDGAMWFTVTHIQTETSAVGRITTS